MSPRHLCYCRRRPRRASLCTIALTQQRRLLSRSKVRQLRALRANVLRRAVSLLTPPLESGGILYPVRNCLVPQQKGNPRSATGTRPVRSGKTRTGSLAANHPVSWSHSRGWSLSPPVHSAHRASANSSKHASLATLHHHEMKLRSLAHPLSRKLPRAVARGLLAVKRSNPSFEPTATGVPASAAQLKR